MERVNLPGGPPSGQTESSAGSLLVIQGANVSISAYQPGTRIAPMDTTRKPAWLRAKLPSGPAYSAVRGLVDEHKLHTVCQSAQCPNLGECWSRGHGDPHDPWATSAPAPATSARSRRAGRPSSTWASRRASPRRSPRWACATASSRASPATSWPTAAPRSGRRRSAPSATATRPPRSRSSCPTSRAGSHDVDTVLDARPDIFNHNVETVERLQKPVRVQARYDRSRSVLRHAKGRGFTVKTGIMLGLGERAGRDRADAARPRRRRGQHPDDRPVPPADDAAPAGRPLGDAGGVRSAGRSSGSSIGFGVVESGPLVRSSYHADEQSLKYTGEEHLNTRNALARRRRTTMCALNTRRDIVENWLPRYTGVPLEKFGEYILLTNFQKLRGPVREGAQGAGPRPRQADADRDGRARSRSSTSGWAARTRRRSWTS